MTPARFAPVLLLALAAPMAQALDFRAVEAPTVFYDAPSTKAKKLFSVGRHYPVEVIVLLEGWAKVRDVKGELAWVERKALTEKRTVLVTAAPAQVRKEPKTDAPLVFQAEKDVALELVEIAGAWVKVRHADGLAGYVQSSQVWGL
jgi:SH3-like domain-containing protein